MVYVRVNGVRDTSERYRPTTCIDLLHWRNCGAKLL